MPILDSCSELADLLHEHCKKCGREAAPFLPPICNQAAGFGPDRRSIFSSATAFLRSQRHDDGADERPARATAKSLAQADRSSVVQDDTATTRQQSIMIDVIGAEGGAVMMVREQPDGGAAWQLQQLISRSGEPQRGRKWTQVPAQCARFSRLPVPRQASRKRSNGAFSDPPHT